MHIVDLGESFPTRIYLENASSASCLIQRDELRNPKRGARLDVQTRDQRGVNARMALTRCECAAASLRTPPPVGKGKGARRGGHDEILAREEAAGSVALRWSHYKEK